MYIQTAGSKHDIKLTLGMLQYVRMRWNIHETYMSLQNPLKGVVTEINPFLKNIQRYGQ